MKKYVLLVFSVFLFTFFTSCEKNTMQNDFLPVQSFSMHMTVNKGDTEFEADISCVSSQEMTLTFTSPKELSGFSVTASESAYSVNVFGVPDEIYAEEIKPSSLINVLTKSIRTAVFKNHGSFVFESDKVSADLNIDGVPVHITFTDDGYISSVEADSADFFAVFQKSG